jgi:hypothetical protein
MQMQIDIGSREVCQFLSTALDFMDQCIWLFQGHFMWFSADFQRGSYLPDTATIETNIWAHYINCNWLGQRRLPLIESGDDEG